MQRGAKDLPAEVWLSHLHPGVFPATAEKFYSP